MRESTFEKGLKRMLEAIGCWCLKFWPGYITGFPDRIVLIPGGRIIFVETKTPTGKLSARQRLVHKQLRRLNFSVECVTNNEERTDFINTLKCFYL